MNAFRKRYRRAHTGPRDTAGQFLCRCTGDVPLEELWKKSSYSFALSRGELMSRADQSELAPPHMEAPDL
jgi:hypothetical protein